MMQDQEIATLVGMVNTMWPGELDTPSIALWTQCWGTVEVADKLPSSAPETSDYLFCVDVLMELHSAVAMRPHWSEVLDAIRSRVRRIEGEYLRRGALPEAGKVLTGAAAIAKLNEYRAAAAKVAARREEHDHHRGAEHCPVCVAWHDREHGGSHRSGCRVCAAITADRTGQWPTGTGGW